MKTKYLTKINNAILTASLTLPTRVFASDDEWSKDTSSLIGDVTDGLSYIAAPAFGLAIIYWAIKQAMNDRIEFQGLVNKLILGACVALVPPLLNFIVNYNS